MAKHSEGAMPFPLKLALAWAILLAAFTASVTLSYLIPPALVNDNILASIPYNQADERGFVEGDWSTDASQSTFSIMLSLAQHGGTNPLADAMEGPWYRTDELGIHDSVAQGLDATPNQSYERYWNGWLVILKPLLLFADYGGVKKITWLAFLALLAATCIGLSKRLRRGMGYSLALCAGFALAGINGIDMFPYALVMLLSLGACLFTLHFAPTPEKPRSQHTLYLGFFAIGALTAFLDFLTTPAITILLPQACYILVQGEGHVKARDLARSCLILGCLWVLGYAGLWFSKWVFASLILGTDVIGNGITQVLLRSNVEGVIGYGRTHAETMSRGEEIGPLTALARNVYAMFPGKSICLAALAPIIAIAFAGAARNRRESWPVAAALLVCAVLPYVWYAVAANHSTIHFLFTYRLQLATVFCLLAISIYFAPQRRS